MSFNMMLLIACWMLMSSTIAQLSPYSPVPPPVPTDSVAINTNRTADLAPGGHRFAFRLYVNVGPGGIPPASQGSFFDSTREALAGVFLVRSPSMILSPKCATEDILNTIKQLEFSTNLMHFSSDILIADADSV